MISTFEAVLAAGFDSSLLASLRPICAYIDPGTGSLVFQILLGGALAGIVTIKLFWRQLKAFAVRLIGRKSAAGSAWKPPKSCSATCREPVERQQSRREAKPPRT